MIIFYSIFFKVLQNNKLQFGKKLEYIIKNFGENLAMANILEILELRSVKKSKPQVLKIIDNMFAANMKKDDYKIKIYSHSTIETDYSIHIHYQSNENSYCGCKLGYKLKNVLKEFGLINHSIWIDRNL